MLIIIERVDGFHVTADKAVELAEGDLKKMTWALDLSKTEERFSLVNLFRQMAKQNDVDLFMQFMDHLKSLTVVRDSERIQCCIAFRASLNNEYSHRALDEDDQRNIKKYQFYMQENGIEYHELYDVSHWVGVIKGDSGG